MESRCDLVTGNNAYDYAERSVPGCSAKGCSMSSQCAGVQVSRPPVQILFLRTSRMSTTRPRQGKVITFYPGGKR